MNCGRIMCIVQHELSSQDPLQLIKLQNHIYGCFILMEDIAEKTVTLTGNIVSTPDFSFDIDADFGEIGLRYGFAMDMKLMLTPHLEEYKAAWLSCFQQISESELAVSTSDTVEDALIGVIQKTVGDSYFLQAIRTGQLPQLWMSKLMGVLKGIHDTAEHAVTTVTAADTVNVIADTVNIPSDTIVNEEHTEDVVEPINSFSKLAHVEKSSKKQNPLKKTRKHAADDTKKYLAVTRKAKKC